MEALEASINAALVATQGGQVGPRLNAKSNLDFQPYMKTSERVNTYLISDWSVNKKNYGRQAQSGVAGGFAFKNDEETSFNEKVGNKGRAFLRPGAKTAQTAQTHSRLTGKKQMGTAAPGQSNQRGPGAAPNQNGQRRPNYPNQNQNNNRNNNTFQFRGRTNREIVRSYSCALPSSWENISRFPLQTPHGTTMPAIRTLARVGTLESLSTDLRSITPKQPKTLQTTEVLNTAEVPIENDPYIQQLLKDNDNLGEDGTFVMTATVAALLMCSHHTIQPWDLDVNVTATNGVTFITTGSNANSIINQHLVDETTLDRLPQDTESINSITSLAQEATAAQNLARNMLISRGTEPVKFDSAVPQVTAEGTPVVTSYIYNRFVLDDMAVIVRSRQHAHTPGKPNEVVYIGSCFEFDGSFGGYHVDYRKNLDTLFASVFSNELKTNVGYMHRMACEAMLSGSTEVRLCWISRSTPANNAKHQIVSTTSHSFVHFIGMLQSRRIDYYEGLSSVLAELLVDQGEYTLLREPNERSLSLYKQNPVDEAVEQV